MRPQYVTLLFFLQFFTVGAYGMKGLFSTFSGEPKNVRPFFNEIALDDIVLEKDPLNEESAVVFIAVQDKFHAWLVLGKYSSYYDCFFICYCPTFWFENNYFRTFPKSEKISRFYDGKELNEENYTELKAIKKKLKEKASLHLGNKFIALQVDRRNFCDLVVVVLRSGREVKKRGKKTSEVKIKERLVLRKKKEELSRISTRLEKELEKEGRYTGPCLQAVAKYLAKKVYEGS